MTTFTTWQRWFRWDSIAAQAKVVCESDSDDDTPESETADIKVAKHRWHKQRVTDRSGNLARELSGQVHRGDPEGEGVIWPHLAEISLLGGLGCGAALLRTILAELEQTTNPYTHVVLQAAENAVVFYEKMGFIRIGAVAKYTKEIGRASCRERV